MIDEEGGAVVQPTPGFVIKTQAAQAGKVFVNMTSHEFVEGFSQKSIPKSEADKHGTAETGLRIPLSLGQRREESDKKGEPALVVDVIWAPETIAECLTNAGFRQNVVELAFGYIQQKYGLDLDLRFTIPKMKYKGATVQFQRIKAKKNPKIQEIEMSPEERAEMERKGLEEQKLKESQAEKQPQWKLYCATEAAYFDQKHWIAVIDRAFEESAGDEEARWNALQESFETP